MTSNRINSKYELHKLILAGVFPSAFMFLCWMIFILEVSLSIDLTQYGLLPRNLTHWYGVLTMPFLHGSLDHILSNSISFIILGTMIFYFYHNQALQVFLWSYFLSGALTWIIGRDSFHIGASAMIYAFAGYVFTAGIVSKNKNLSAVSLIVVFLYGSMIWGIFPQDNGISWEGHLSGLIVGVVLALIYKPVKHVESDEHSNYYHHHYHHVVHHEFHESNYNCTEDDDIDLKYHYKCHDLEHNTHIKKK